jgi:AraC-like DNA-binding protein
VFLWSLPCALIHVLLGERKQALDWLERYTNTINALGSLQYAPQFAELRDEPRFLEIVRRPGVMLARDRPLSLRDKAPSNGWLGQVERYVDAHLGDELSITVLAGIAQTSAFHFARQFKTLTGTTPHQYILRRRIERAKLLLKDLGLSIADIAIACGFATQAHLTTVFRKEVGVAPGVFRTYQP